MGWEVSEGSGADCHDRSRITPDTTPPVEQVSALVLMHPSCHNFYYHCDVRFAILRLRGQRKVCSFRPCKTVGAFRFGKEDPGCVLQYIFMQNCTGMFITHGSKSDSKSLGVGVEGFRASGL